MEVRRRNGLTNQQNDRRESSGSAHEAGMAAGFHWLAGPKIKPDTDVADFQIGGQASSIADR
jgi:hypothetical protein